MIRGPSAVSRVTGAWRRFSTRQTRSVRATPTSENLKLLAAELRETIERFIASCREPALCEDGEESLAITADNFALETRNDILTLQAWDDRRNLARRVTGIEQQTRVKLVLLIERFGKRTGTLSLLDLRGAKNQNVTLRSGRLEFRELFRRFLRRQFPSSKIAELTTEADLEHSLSPAYPRALLRHGTSAWVAIGASTEAFHSDGVLTFGLIWLDYVRRRNPELVVHGLILYLPRDREKTTCLRLLFLDPKVAQYQAFVYSEEGLEEGVDLRDYGNLDTRVEPCRRRLPSELDALLEPVRNIEGVETIDRSDGELSLRVFGLEFGRTNEGTILAGLQSRRAIRSSNMDELVQLASELTRLRSPNAPDRQNPLYLRNPEAWIESQVRNQIEQVDARLLSSPIYGQVPAFAAADRGVLDLLAVDRHGRLTVLELKASEDIHLPLQALDYWLRVKWHLERREFTANGYFPGIELLNDAPRLLLISPALDYHPSNECILRYLSPDIEVERVGLSLEWHWGLKVMFRS
jgi:hypothetical protein